MNRVKKVICKLKDIIIKNKEVDEITLLEIESLGIKIYPPNSYPEK